MDSAPPRPVPPPAAAPELASLTAFMNALAREWSRCQWLGPGGHPLAGVAGALRLPLTRPAGALLLPLRHRSLAGRHRFDGRLHLLPAGGGELELDFAQAVALLAAEPTLAEADQGCRRLFLRRVLDSAANLAAAEHERRAALAQLAWPQADYLAAEQGLVHGHPVHPTPKSRDEFSAEDLRRYSPEFGGRAPLCWFALRGPALWQDDVGVAPACEQLSALHAADPALQALAGRHPRAAGWQLLPVHPWQARVLRGSAAYRHWHARGCLHDFGEHGTDWFATSSLRTLYAPHAPAMLKFSLSVRLTNSRRVLQPAEVRRGRLIHGAFASSLGRALLRDCPTLGILHETAAFALATPEGEPLPESFVILRDNPFAPGDTSYVMATLNQDGCHGRPSMAARLIRELAARSGQPPAEVALDWFDRFLEHALRPFLIAQAGYGVLVSAHAQNTVLVLREGWPAGVWFRDCQGTTFHPDTIAALAGEVAGIEAAAELSFSDAEVDRLLGYYLIVNTVFGLVTALGGDGVAGEAALLARMRAFLQALRAQPLRHPHFIDYLLRSPQLMSKGNFMICFGNLNETTDAAGSYRSYVPLANPLAGLASPTERAA